MSKRFTIQLLIFIFVLLAGHTWAAAYHSDNVKDYLNFLTIEEVNVIQERVENVVQDFNLDIVMVITADTQGKSSRDFADDYYDHNGFGVGEDYSGLLMLVNMEGREVWISTTGRAIDIYTDGRIAAMNDSVASFLTQERYYEACADYVNIAADYAARGVPEGQYRIETPASNTYMNRVSNLAKSWLVALVCLIIAVIATITASLSNKGSVTINSQTYEENGSFELCSSNDDYIRESTTRIIIPSSSSSSIGSSTHRGSSGRTHGGGGRKF